MGTRHCHKCGWEYKLTNQPGRSETCHGCGADLRVCLNCTAYDLRAAHQCRDRRADPVQDKHMANYCEWFELIRRDFKADTSGQSAEEKARANLKKLFGD